MIVATSEIVLGPLVLCLCVLEFLSALFVLCGREGFERMLRVGRTGVWSLALLGAFFAVLSGHYNQDWVYNFWAAQVPMVGLFLSSGMFLCRVWCDDAKYLAKEGSGELLSEHARTLPPLHPAWLFLVMLVVLSLIPLALQLLSPASYANPYSTGRPVWNLVELARWGVGGPIPTYLAEVGPDGVVHAHQDVPREVTVPMGTTLIAAWLWIQFCVIALIGRLVPWPRLRIGAYLLAPLGIGILWLSGSSGLPWGKELALDPRYFGPLSARSSGIWEDEGATLASYGGVMLVAAICTVVLALALGIEHFISRRRSMAAALASPQSGATFHQREQDELLRLTPRNGSAGLEGC